jgi:SAM-dependent methyltransferase
MTVTGESGFQLKQGGPETYELCWVRAQMGRAAEELVATAGVGPGDRVLDIGCGTGVVARLAATRTGAAANVTGADVSADMLEAAARFAAKAGLAEIAWLECDAADMPLPDAAFDIALCQQGLQFMPDKPGAMAEMARVLTPGGRLALSVWKTRSPLGAAFTTVLDRHFGAGTTAPWEMVYSLGNRDILHELAKGAGFRDAHVVLDVKFIRHPDPKAFITGALAGSPLAGTMADLPPAEHAELVEEIVAELADCRDDDGLAVPSQCLTLSARK